MRSPGNQDHLPFTIDNLRISLPGNRNRTHMVPRSYHQGSDEEDFDHLYEGGGSPAYSDSNADEDIPYMPGRIASTHTASRSPLLAPDDSQQQSISPDAVSHSPQFAGDHTQQREPVAGGGNIRDRASGHAVRGYAPQRLGHNSGLRLLAPNYAKSGAPHVQHNRNIIFPGDRGHPSTGIDPSRLYATPYEPTYSSTFAPQDAPSEVDARWLEETEQYLRGLLNIPIDRPVNLYSLPDPPPGERPGPLPNLVKLAIFGSPGRRLTLQGICNALEDRFDWFRDQSVWKGSIRHLLTLQKMIVKTPRPINEPGKGSYWTLDISQGEGPTHERKRNRKRSSKVKDEQIESEMAADYEEMSSSNTGSPLIGELSDSLLPEGSHGLHRRQPVRRRTSPYPPSSMASPINAPSSNENAIIPPSIQATGLYTMPAHVQTHPAFGQPSLIPRGYTHPPGQTPPFGYPPFTGAPAQGVNVPRTSGFTAAAGPYIPMHPGGYPASTQAMHAAQGRERRPQDLMTTTGQMQSEVHDSQLDPALLDLNKTNEETPRTKDRKGKRRQL